jgi:hypothetical protein
MHRRLLSLVTFVMLSGSMGFGCGGDDDSTPPPPPPAENQNPTLTGPTAQSTQVTSGSAVTLSVTAADPEADTLTYAWEQTSPAAPAGIFSSTTTANPTWTAPTVSTRTAFTLRVTVSDGNGGSAQGTVTLNVDPKAVENQPPEVAVSITAPSTLKAGATGTFSITATDPEGDALTYTWTQKAPAQQGTFVGVTTGTSAQWFSPQIGAETPFTIEVSVSDGKAAPVVRTVNVPVTVPNYSDVQSLWSTNTLCTGCHGSAGGLNLAEGSSYAALVNVANRNAACNTLKRVLPSDPDNSALVRKIEGTTCGNRMPRGANVAHFDNNPGQLILIRSWILGGALNN